MKLMLLGYCFSGVCEVLGYFLLFLKLVLEKECLLDFFFGNEYLDKIFLGLYFFNICIKYNLFVKENFEFVEVVKFGFFEIESIFVGCFDVGNLNFKVVNFFRDRVFNM